MATSEARIQANRTNSLKSSGPRTPEGRARSRQNGLKHGLTGAGIVLAEQDAAEVDRRNKALQSELAPKSEMGKILVLQMATLSVRMERSARQETAAIAERVRNAVGDFDQSRLDEAQQLMDTLGESPRTNLRKLRGTPEGVEALIGAWQDLRADLSGETWTPSHGERAKDLAGSKGGPRIVGLSRAILGDFSGLVEGSELDEADRKAWARLLMAEEIEARIGELEAHYETLDFETIELDREQAPTRALFDPSKEASLARRYESEARRGFFRAMRELKRAEAEAAERPAPVATPEPEAACEALGSSCETTPAPREPRPSSPRPAHPTSDRGSESSDPRPSSHHRMPIGAV